jgi:hypothetical protein
MELSPVYYIECGPTVVEQSTACFIASCGSHWDHALSYMNYILLFLEIKCTTGHGLC